MLAVTHYAHNVIILLRRECCWLVAATMFIWLPANGADRDPSNACGIDETIWHIKLLSHIADVGDCITGEILGRIPILPSLCSSIYVNEQIGRHVYSVCEIDSKQGT
jgi:hypothetical protein